MYDPIEVADRINSLLKSKSMQQKVMLEECGLNKNAISYMKSRGSMLKADNLAKIADYLDCSVDYLLGNTDDPAQAREKESSPQSGELVYPDWYRKLTLEEAEQVQKYAYFLISERRKDQP